METKLQPKLRFPEFISPFNEYMIKDVLELISRPLKMKDKESYSLVTVKRRAGGIKKREELLGNEIKVKTQFYIHTNDYVISKRQIVHGAFGIVPKNLNNSIVSNEYNVLNPKKNCDINYFNYLSFSPKMKQAFFLSSDGVHIEKMLFKTNDWLKRKFLFPSLIEQKKIASFISFVDTKTEKLEDKKDLLINYKKGVTQNVFSQKIRFKNENGENYPVWKRKKLEEVFKSARGKGLSKDKLNANGSHGCILYGELYTTYCEIISDIKSKTNSEEGELSKIGDLLIPSSTTTSGIDLANVTALNEENIKLGGDITVLRAVQKINNIFYAYYLTNHKKIELANFAQGSTIIHLYYNHFKKIIIDIPCLEEQEKIASFLSAIDRKIEVVNIKIDEMKVFKKGLLQQMFV